MADQWYYAKGNTKYGPLSGGELKQLADSGELNSADLVWKTGMENWQSASSIKGLFTEPHVPRTHSTSEPPPPRKIQPPSPPPPLAPKATGNRQRTRYRRIRQELFAAVTTKSKELAEKAIDAANHYQAKRQEQASATTPEPNDRSVEEPLPTATNRDTETTLTGQKPIPKWAKWTATGGCVALVSMCLFCGLIGALVDALGGGTDMGISQEVFLRPTPTLDIESVMTDSGVPLRRNRKMNSCESGGQERTICLQRVALQTNLQAYFCSAAIRRIRRKA